MGMDILYNISIGVSVVLQPVNLMYAFIGVCIGTLIGVLPGIGPVAAISLLLPATFKGDVTSGLIMLAGIFYGTQYGGSTTSILVNIPGEAASVITCIDGYKMSQKGKAGPALGIAAMGSFIAGTFALIMLTLLAPKFAQMAFKFNSPEFVAMAVLGLSLVVTISGGSMIKGLMMATVGLALGVVGMDLLTGSARFTFGILELESGIGLVPVAMGLFGIGEVFIQLDQSLEEHKVSVHKLKFKELFPSWGDWKKCSSAITQGSILGFLIGVIPGGTPVVASLASYAIQKKISKHPEEMGKGAIEGVAAPEAANNAATGGAFIPLLTLGIPTTPVMALLLGSFMMHGIIPGPLLMSSRPDLFWGLILSMYVGNVMLLILNLPMIGIWVRILKVPYGLLFPLILVFCVIGAYTVNNSIVDVALLILFGVIGFIMRKLDYDPAPLILALVMGPILEENLKRTLSLSDGSLTIFLQHPIALSLFLLSILSLFSPQIMAAVRARRARSSVLKG